MDIMMNYELLNQIFQAFGFKMIDEGLLVHFYDIKTGEELTTYKEFDYVDEKDNREYHAIVESEHKDRLFGKRFANQTFHICNNGYDFAIIAGYHYDKYYLESITCKPIDSNVICHKLKFPFHGLNMLYESRNVETGDIEKLSLDLKATGCNKLDYKCKKQTSDDLSYDASFWTNLDDEQPAWVFDANVDFYEIISNNPVLTKLIAALSPEAISKCSRANIPSVKNIGKKPINL